MNGNPAGTVRIATDGTDLGIASSWGTRVAVVVLHGSSSTPRSFDLAGTPSLPGLVRVEVASVRFNGGAASIALTAHLDHPKISTTSVGAILRIRADGTHDVNFGWDGIWVSPLGVGHRDLVCAGEAPAAWRGVSGGRTVAFAIDPNGTGLDQSFADSGVAEHDLGGPLAGPVMAFDASGVTISPNASRRRVIQPAISEEKPWAAVSSGLLAPRTMEPSSGSTFGVAGTVMLHCDEAPITPAGIAVSGSQMFVGGTRQIRGADCDRMPVVVALSLPTAAPNVNYGGGGFALLGSVRNPALVAPDGSAVFAERSTATTVPALRFTTPSGAQGPLRSLAPISAGTRVSALGPRLADGSIIVAGSGPDAWVAKMGPTGALDPAFGNAGIALPNAVGSEGDARVLGIRSDGNMAVVAYTGALTQLTVIEQNGQIDTTYGTGGFLDIKGFTHPGGISDARCFLDTDDSVICVASAPHEPANTFSSPVAVGLRTRHAHRRIRSELRIGSAKRRDSSGRDLPTFAEPGRHNWRTLRLLALAPARYGAARHQAVRGGHRVGPAAPTSRVSTGTGRHIRCSSSQRGTSMDRSMRAFRPAACKRRDTTTILWWSASGVIPDSATSFFIFGNAGNPETITTTVGTTTNMEVKPRQPQPALYRVEHPNGLDLAFGGDGVSTIRVQEFVLTSVAGAMVTGGRVRVACIDALEQPWSNDPPRQPRRARSGDPDGRDPYRSQDDRDRDRHNRRPRRTQFVVGKQQNDPVTQGR